MVKLEYEENLFHQGDDSHSTYLVIDGLLVVAVIQEDGSELFVGEIKPGALVGEMGVFTGQGRTASLSASTDPGVSLVTIPESAFSRIAADEPHAHAPVAIKSGVPSHDLYSVQTAPTDVPVASHETISWRPWLIPSGYSKGYATSLS